MVIHLSKEKQPNQCKISHKKKSVIPGLFQVKVGLDKNGSKVSSKLKIFCNNALPWLEESNYAKDALVNLHVYKCKNNCL